MSLAHARILLPPDDSGCADSGASPVITEVVLRHLHRAATLLPGARTEPAAGPSAPPVIADTFAIGFPGWRTARPLQENLTQFSCAASLGPVFDLFAPSSETLDQLLAFGPLFRVLTDDCVVSRVAPVPEKVAGYATFSRVIRGKRVTPRAIRADLLRFAEMEPTATSLAGRIVAMHQQGMAIPDIAKALRCDGHLPHYCYNSGSTNQRFRVTVARSAGKADAPFKFDSFGFSTGGAVPLLPLPKL